ncbi:surface antigen P46 [Mesomycoplasma hyopneumoniae]|uniref:Sugar ABC transporter substrate-binding protein n=1 Tax=Mesomycoplasma hyopneumoniae TaxID=2099 RepID=A0ABD4SYI5_MESHO|nr:sugar-binding protein [Mesomycoplasma hyopneumoniae]MCI8283546.1 sugar ABC transporter substrate-binding protein [Mesomycoplasma hyopneumoniae]MCI8298476.1 sugar ABC transporter substrate-binding protein [Mesomycoplasma hyopneumoniae]
MKKMLRKKFLYSSAIYATSLASIIAFVAAGCGQTESGSTSDSKPQAETLKHKVSNDSIRIALTDPDNPRWISAQKDIISYVDETEAATSTITKNQDAQNNWLTQQANLSPAPKGFIIAPENGSGVGTAVNTIADKGIPIVAYDRLITGSDKYDWYVSFDNEKVGELQGLSLAAGLLGKEDGAFDSIDQMNEYLKSHMPQETISFYTIAGSQDDNNSQYFYNGAMKVLKELMKNSQNKIIDLSPEGENAVYVPGWNYGTAGQRIQSFLTINKDPQGGNKIKAVGSKPASIFKGFLAPNDGMAEQAITKLKLEGFDTQKIFVTGQDYNDKAKTFIKDGDQNMTIYKPDKVLGKVAVEVLRVLIAKKNKASRSEVENELKAKLPNISFKYDNQTYKVQGKNINTILVSPVIVTKANVDNPDA